LGALPLDPTGGGSAPRHRYRLVIHALAMRVHPTFFDLVTPLLMDNYTSVVSNNARAGA